MNNKKVTYIEELIDLDDLNSSPSFNKQIHNESMERESYSKPLQNKIRNNVDFRVAMNGGRPPNDDFEYQMGPRVNQQRVSENYNTKYIYGYGKYNNYDYNNSYNNPNSTPQHPYETDAYFEEPYRHSFNCLDISNHLKGCPICSKLYDNDKSVYIVAIVVLIIIVIILLKKVIENIGSK